MLHPESFRKEVLYFEAVDEVFRDMFFDLQEVYKNYASLKTTSYKRMAIVDFIAVVKDGGLMVRFINRMCGLIVSRLADSVLHH